MPAEELATRLTGGVTLAELPADIVGRDRARAACRPTSSSRRSRTSCSCATRARGSTAACRSTRCSGRRASTRRSTSRRSTASTRASATPAFRSGSAASTTTGAAATLEGGDMMPVGDGVVLVGQGERSQRARGEHPRPEPVRRGRRAAGHRRADAAHARGDAPRHRVHVLRPPRRDDLRAGRVGDRADPATAPTATAACAREVSERSFVDELKDALGLTDLTLVATGGDEFEAERNQWDDGNNVVALSPGVDRRLRAQRGHQRQARQGRRRGPRDRGPGARPRARRRPLHDLPDLP